MPYCQISPDISLYYITNSPGGDVSLFDRSKPTILLLHPVALDVTWLKAQFKEPRLTKSYNMIAFDQRNAGRTKSSYSARRDSYVDAADLGFALELLQIPPVHIFAVQLNSVWAAVRLALLFPSKCLSLCLCSVPSDIPLDWTPKAYTELVEIWCFPPDLETFEQANLEMSHFMFGGQIAAELEDEIVGWWQVNMSPRRRSSVMELTFGRCAPSPQEYARLKLPTLMMTGDKSAAHPLEEAIKTHEQLKGSQLYVVKGAPEMFLVLPQYTSIAHRVYTDFLSRQDPPPHFTPGRPSLEQTSRQALARLADVFGDPSVASRDPTDPLSFSMWPPEAVARQQAFLDQFAVGEDQALSPLNAHGLPIRRFSRRHDDQWSPAAFYKMQSSIQALKGIQIESTS